VTTPSCSSNARRVQDQHVGGDAGAAEDLVRQAGAPALGRRVVRHDEQDA
jgi:hypothetical protein